MPTKYLENLSMDGLAGSLYGNDLYDKINAEVPAPPSIKIGSDFSSSVGTDPTGFGNSSTLKIGNEEYSLLNTGELMNKAGGTITPEQAKLLLASQTPETNFMGLTAGQTAQGLAGVAGLGLGAYLGNKQLGLMKDQLNLQRDQLKTTQADVGYKSDGGVGSTRKSRSAAAASRAFG